MIKKGTKENYSSNKTNISETSQELAYQQLLIEKTGFRTVSKNYCTEVYGCLCTESQNRFIQRYSWS